MYFAEQSEDTFVKSQLKVEVGVKEKAGDRPLCYCFDHSVTSIKRELEATGESTAVEDIRSRMKGDQPQRILLPRKRGQGDRNREG